MQDNNYTQGIFRCCFIFLQVLQLLDSLGLRKYRAIVHARGVDGRALSQYTEERLYRDLSITSQLDRSRLLNVIKMKEVRLVPGADGANYVAFEKSN